MKIIDRTFDFDLNLIFICRNVKKTVRDIVNSGIINRNKSILIENYDSEKSRSKHEFFSVDQLSLGFMFN